MILVPESWLKDLSELAENTFKKCENAKNEYEYSTQALMLIGYCKGVSTVLKYSTRVKPLKL